MTDYKWIEEVAKHHKEWVEVIYKLGEKDYAEDIVQESYMALIKYADEKKLIDENGKVRKGYMFFTLRSLYYQFYNKKKKVNKVSFDEQWEIFDDSNLEEQEAYNDICLMIDKELETWGWYDKKLFKLYRDTDLSMRDIASETTISLISIFHSIKNYKEILRNKFQNEYDEYKNNDFNTMN